MAEERILRLFLETNRPRNVQGVSDMLATQGVKKAQAEKALASLAEGGKIICKEFGKTKLFIPCQDGLEELLPEEKAKKLAEIQQLQADCKEQEGVITGLKRELQAANSTLSLEELRAKIEQLQKETGVLGAKLSGLKSGAQLVSAADVAVVEKNFVRLMDSWAKHKRQFRGVWDQVADNLDGSTAALFEEIGIESDEAVGEMLSTYQQLLPKKVCRR